MRKFSSFFKSEHHQNLKDKDHIDRFHAAHAELRAATLELHKRGYHVETHHSNNYAARHSDHHRNKGSVINHNQALLGKVRHRISKSAIDDER